MSNDGKEMENEEESGEDQSEEVSRSSRRSSRSKAQSDSKDKRSRGQKKKAAKHEKMRQVVSATIQARIMREAPENGPFQPRRDSGGSSRSRSSKSAPQFSEPNRGSEDDKSDENLIETKYSVASENTSLVSKFSSPPLEIVQNGEADEDEILPGLSEEEDDNGPDFLERLEKDIESGCSFRRIKIQTEFLDSERAEIKKSQWRWRMTNEKMFLRHFGQLRDITWLADQQDFVLQEMKTAEINKKWVCRSWNSTGCPNWNQC